MPTPAAVRRLLPVLAAGPLLVAGCHDATSPTDLDPGAPASAVVATAGAPLTFRVVSGGSYYSCGVTTDDRAYCWGMNDVGQLGNGTTGNSAVPVAVSGNHRFRTVEAGPSHACAITTDDLAWCWGSNQEGQLGDGTRTGRLAPVLVKTVLRFRQISAGQFHTCAVTPTDRPHCWGANRKGQVGDGSGLLRQKKPVPVKTSLHFQWVSAGAQHSCGVTTDGRGFCWGDGGSGQLGTGKTFVYLTPRPVAGGLSFRDISAGDNGTSSYYSCGVTTDDRAFCWGGNFDGQLGDATTTTRLTPKLVAGGNRFARVATGERHTCGVSTAGAAYCWGYNYYGALGDGGPLGDAANVHRSPFPVAGGLAFARIAAGRTHSCGVTTGGAAYCWGGNTAGQLGDGVPDFASSTLRAVVGPS